MLKIGIGPSSSHTLGPWRAAESFVQDLQSGGLLEQVHRLKVELYGSLALTGTGHGTDIALMMGLSSADPVTVPLEEVHHKPARIQATGELLLGGTRPVSFDPLTAIEYHRQERLPEHANGMRFFAYNSAGAELLHLTAYSIGGGFVLRTGEEESSGHRPTPYDVSTGERLLAACRTQTESPRRIADVARINERTSRSNEEIDGELLQIWEVMKRAVYRACHTSGSLPGGLDVTRRAPQLAGRLMGTTAPQDLDGWYATLAEERSEFARTLKFVGCFAIAVNEENAAFGRIVTAPTNGSAGVIPAVALYYRYLSGRATSEQDIVEFLLVAGVIGGIFKNGATISAAMGGCQAEIGVSSAMAAAALTEGLGGSPQQALMAAEIAMEHHLGLTCDPIAGLVQIPCIERNSMGAIKAITAAHIALESDSALAKVSLDDVVRTMWATAQDMNTRYKETSLGGLAVNVSVRVPEC